MIYLLNFGVETPLAKKSIKNNKRKREEGVEVYHRDSDSNYST